jgi:hypothetical protein
MRRFILEVIFVPVLFIGALVIAAVTFPFWMNKKLTTQEQWDLDTSL